MPIIGKHNEKTDAIAIKLGRAGFIGRGFVWACIGGVAVSAAFTGHKTEGQTGALDVVAASTGGAVILALATIAIFAYAGWRLFEGLYGLRVKQDDKKWKKVINGYVVPFASFLFYIIFAVGNIYTIVKGRRNGGTDILGKIAGHVIGDIFLSLAGVILFGVALGWVAQMIKGTIRSEGIRKQKLYESSWIKYPFYFCMHAGTVGRAFLFILLGVLFFRVAWDGGLSEKSAGFGEALSQLQGNTFGKIVLVVTGIFLIFFGIWSVMMARYKEFLPYKAHLLPVETRQKVKDKKNEVKSKAKEATKDLGEDFHRNKDEDEEAINIPSSR